MMINRIKKNTRSDNGAGITIMSLVILGLLLLMTVFIFDFNKNIYLQNNYTQMTQRAAQRGLKEQNNIGGLTPNAALAVIEEYKAQRDSTAVLRTNTGTKRGTNDSTVFRSVCQAKYPSYPEITVQFSTSRKGGWGTEYKYRNGSWVNNPTSNTSAFYSNQYRSIRVKVKDTGDNYFYGLFGQPCSNYSTQATSTSIFSDAGNTGY